jgi:hypothetical protein
VTDTWRWVAGVVAGLVAGAGVVVASTPPPEALHGWNRYVALVDQRRAKEAADRSRFLIMDFVPEGAAERRVVMTGGMVVQPMEARDSAGQSIDVPSAIVHHWRGAVLLPGTTLPRLMATLESDPPPTGPDVLASAVLARGRSSFACNGRVLRQSCTTHNTRSRSYAMAPCARRASVTRRRLQRLRIRTRRRSTSCRRTTIAGFSGDFASIGVTRPFLEASSPNASHSASAVGFHLALATSPAR